MFGLPEWDSSRFLSTSFSITGRSSAAKSTIEKMAIARSCLKTGTEFLQLSDLRKEQPKTDTAAHTQKKTLERLKNSPWGINIPKVGFT